MRSPGRILIMSILVVSACSPGGNTNVSKSTPDEPVKVSTPPEVVRDAIGHIRAVTLEGAPLPAMLPIATRKANAFDPPLSTGDLTDEDGRSQLLLPQGEQVYVRAWDPSFGYFANNYFTVLPNPGEATDEMVVTMAKSATLSAHVTLPNGEPIAHEEVSLLLTYPTQGPWWPKKALSDDTGIVIFDGLPPGEYILRFETPQGHALEVPRTFLAPGKNTDIPNIALF